MVFQSLHILSKRTSLFITERVDRDLKSSPVSSPSSGMNAGHDGTFILNPVRSGSAAVYLLKNMDAPENDAGEFTL